MKFDTRNDIHDIDNVGQNIQISESLLNASMLQNVLCTKNV